MEIVEPKSDNSGMLYGTLVKRHRFPSAAAPERLASPADLRVGGTFRIYGKTFAITACDASTRVNTHWHLWDSYEGLAIAIENAALSSIELRFCEGMVQECRPQPASRD